MSLPTLHIVLHEPEIAENTGNIGRTCVAIGAKLWLVRPLGFRLDQRRLRRAGMDYWDRLDWEAVDDWRALQSRLPMPRPWLLSKSASQLYTEVRYAPGDVLVFGSESRGLPDRLLSEQRDRVLRIPMRAEARSINLSVAAAVAAYEAVRQIAEQSG
jgi:tRNA (cytidine/uridine-2'-O-)-methyltransferase